MRKHRRWLALPLAAALLLGSGCAMTEPIDGPVSVQESVQSAESAQETTAASAAESARETAGQNEAAGLPTAKITLSGDTITASDGAMVNGSTVTLTQSRIYEVSGALDDGQIIVDAGKDGQVILSLQGADITCLHSAPIYVKQADQVVILLGEGTENTVTDGPDYVFAAGEDEPDAAIFSKDDLIFQGDGSLTVNGNYDMAIHGKDDVKLRDSGSYTLTAVGDGLKGKDSVELQGVTLHITAGGDGIQASNSTEKGDIWIAGDGPLTGASITIDAAQDGIKAEHSLTIEGGDIHITAGEDGIKAHNTIGGSELTITGGTIAIDAQQDGIQADGDLFVQGGTIDIITLGGADNAPAHAGDFFGGPPGWFNDTTAEEETASAKGLKSAYDLEISGGTITVDAYDDAIHADGNVTISGEETEITVKTGDDGVHANETLAIQGGSVRIDQSYEGLEGLFIELSGGEIHVTASDDGMNANGDEMFGPGFGGMSGDSDTLETANTYLHISGGLIYVDADGDGLDSNGLLMISGGETYVLGPSNSMNGALDSGTSCQITGGSVIAIGASGMDETFEGGDGAQPSFRCTFNTNLTGDSPVTLTDSAGNELLHFAPDRADKKYNSVVVSLPELTVGESYTLTCGDETVELELTDTATSVRQTAAGSSETATSGGFGGFGGFGGGGPGGGPGGFGGPPPFG